MLWTPLIFLLPFSIFHHKQTCWFFVCKLFRLLLQGFSGASEEFSVLRKPEAVHGFFLPSAESLFEVVARRILAVSSSEFSEAEDFRNFDSVSMNFTFAKWILLKDYLCLGAFDVTQPLKIIKLELFGKLDMATTTQNFDLFNVIGGLWFVSCLGPRKLLRKDLTTDKWPVIESRHFLFALRRNLIGFNYFLGFERISTNYFIRNSKVELQQLAVDIFLNTNDNLVNYLQII